MTSAPEVLSARAEEEAHEHASLLLPLTMEGTSRTHPLDALYAGPNEALQQFLDAHPIMAALHPRVEGFEDERRVISIAPPEPAVLKRLKDVLGDEPGIALRVFHKYFMDQHGNLARRLTLKGPYGQTVLSLNNVGAVGADVTPGVHVNLFVGASETAEASIQPVRDSRALVDWVQAIESPFSEAALNLNAAVSGAHFPHIVRRAERMTDAVKAAGGAIDNLFAYGGWHNLIYNANEPEDWRGYCDALATIAPRTCFFGLASPVLRLSWGDVEAFCRRGHLFWGNVAGSEETYRKVRAKVEAYNIWLADYCAEADDRLFVPVEPMLDYDAASVDEHYRDIVHFADFPGVRRRLAEQINAYLDENAAFFAPKLSDVSEYIYPVF